jgi:pimeloyl-ACP methyl ester carboxylesterase
MPRLQIGEGSLYYERHGGGFPVLFVSGLTGFASFWQDQVAAFAKRFDVITHDHRGIGQSDPSRIGFTVDRMAADVVALMDALEVERAHLIGHSTGGGEVAHYLGRHGTGRVAKAVLVGAVPPLMLKTPANPEGTRCSAQTSEPFPPINSRAPTPAAASQCWRSGGGVPRNRINAYKATMASRFAFGSRKNAG